MPELEVLAIAAPNVMPELEVLKPGLEVLAIAAPNARPELEVLEIAGPNACQNLKFWQSRPQT